MTLKSSANPPPYNPNCASKLLLLVSQLYARPEQLFETPMNVLIGIVDGHLSQSGRPFTS